MTKPQPITPAEVAQLFVETIPDEVIQAFNECITENWNGSSNEATITQRDVVSKICNLMGIDKSDFNYKWLNIEPLFMQSGWQVEYDKPGFNESYEATFCFKGV